MSFFIIVGAGCTGSPASYDYKVIATSMFAAFNRHDWTKMASYYADDAEFLDPSLGKEYVMQSQEDVIAKYSGMQQEIPDIRDDIMAIHVAGASVTVQFTSRGTIGGMPFELPIVTVLTFRDGLIVRDATYYDLENP